MAHDHHREQDEAVRSRPAQSPVSRRTFIGAGVTVAATLGLPAASSFAKKAPRRAGNTLVEVDTGRLRGARAAGVTRFLGVPYAAPPVGALRLRSPRRHAPWAGVRDATRRAASSVQTNAGPSAWIYETASMMPMSEDCLYLNVWTPSTSGRRPVIVFMHGGGNRTGSGTVLGIDGTNLAQDGDVVAVTVNYRLGALGGLAHPSFRDPRTGLSGNWGVQDWLEALRWVRRNIAAFGGDPGNVTISGESWGGMVARDTTLQPANGRLYDKVIASSIRLSPAQTLELSSRYTELLASRLGASVDGLRTLPATAVHEAELALAVDRAAIASIGGAILGVIVDGKTVLHASPFDQQSADVPLLIGTNRNETFIDFNLYDPSGRRVSLLTPPADEASLLTQISSYLAVNYPTGFPAPSPESVRDAYRTAMTARGDAAGPADLFMEFATDVLRRGPSSHWAAKHTQSRRSPAYVYELAQPLAPPGQGTPHTADIPFVFGTYRAPFLAARVGDSRHVGAVSRALARTWTTFAHTGDPSTGGSGGTGRWRPYRNDRRDVATFGGKTVVAIEHSPRRAQLDALPAFTAKP